MTKTILGKSVERAVALLQAGEVVALPTETVYGLAANALDNAAVEKIFQAKNRPRYNPLILHFSAIRAMQPYVAEWPKDALRLLETFSPGPLTLLLPCTDKVPLLTRAGLPKAGFRIPDQSLFLEVLRACQFPLAAPSANPFTYISPTTATHVMDQLKGKIPFILDGGASEKGLESTIIEPTEEGLIVKRMGALSLEELEAHGFDYTLDIASTNSPSTPGQLAVHYSPNKNLRLLDREDLEELPRQDHVLFLLHSKPLLKQRHNSQYILSPSKDDKEAASRLYYLLRSLDDKAGTVIYAERFPEKGLGRTINDRLERAAAK